MLILKKVLTLMREHISSFFSNSRATVADIVSRVLIFYGWHLHHGLHPHHDDVCIEISIVSKTQSSIMLILVTLALPPHIRDVIMMMFASISIVNMLQRLSPCHKDVGHLGPVFPNI